MVTKEQALTCTLFKQVAVPAFPEKDFKLSNPVYWRSNGKCKTWKTRPEEFKLPIKHGLYSYRYIDHTNNHLYEVVL